MLLWGKDWFSGCISTVPPQQDHIPEPGFHLLPQSKFFPKYALLLLLPLSFLFLAVPVLQDLSPQRRHRADLAQFLDGLMGPKLS